MWVNRYNYILYKTKIYFLFIGLGQIPGANEDETWVFRLSENDTSC